MEKLPRLQKDQRVVIESARNKLLGWGVPNSHKEICFLSDMIARLDRKKPLTMRQKSWVLSIVNREEPDREIANRIDKILSIKEVADLHDMLQSFKDRVLSGGALTEKQIKALERCENDAQDAQSGMRFVLTDEHNWILGMCRTLYLTKTMYFHHRPSTDSMLSDIIRKWKTTGWISERQYEAVFKVFKNMLNPVLNPDYKAGEMAKVLKGRYMDNASPGPTFVIVEEDTIALAMSDPDLTVHGHFVQRYLVYDRILSVPIGRLRRPWRKPSKK